MFSRRLLCFVKMKLRERRAAGGTRKEAGFILGFPEALAAKQVVEAVETEVIGSLTDFNWLSDELAAK